MPIDLWLAHSPDPDDVFMWWPLTGQIAPGTGGIDSTGRLTPATPLTPPALDTGPFRFLSLPADIAVLNRRAADFADLHISALSLRAYADVATRYRLTACGSSFGLGYGPKVVCRDDAPLHALSDLADPARSLAVPGLNTTAFMLLGMALGPAALTDRTRFHPLPFEKVIPAVASGAVHAGVVIHEGQVTFADAGLRLLLDLGAWWKSHSGLATPLGVNAVRRDLDTLHGPGTLDRLGTLLSASVRYAAERRAESTAYTLPFALANTARSGADSPERPTLARVDAYCRLYVTAETLDMGAPGRAAIDRLLAAGAALGLCPSVPPVDPL